MLQNKILEPKQLEIMTTTIKSYTSSKYKIELRQVNDTYWVLVYNQNSRTVLPKFKDSFTDRGKAFFYYENKKYWVHLAEKELKA